MVVKKPGTKKDGGTPAGAVDVEVESNNEVVAIESIFGDDFASQVAGEHERHRFALTIKPCPAEADAANLAVVRLLVGLPVNYPLHPPRIALEPVRGLTEPVFAELANLLRARVAEHWGDVVIFELTELVRAFLASHNEPASGWDLHRQMLERRAAQDAEAALPRAHLRAAVGGALAPDANLAAELERIASRQEAERTQRLTSERALLKKGGGARARGKRATRESGDAVELDRVASWSAGDDSDADETAAKARGAAGGKAPVKRPPTVDAKPPPAAVPAGEPARPVSFLPVAARPAGARAADGGGGLIGQLMGALSRSFSNLSLSRAGGRESTGSERSAGAEAEAHALAGEGAASSLERAGAAGVGGAGVRRRRAARRAARRSFGGGEAPSSDDEGDEPGGSHRPARPSVPSAALAEPIPYSTSNRFAALRARPELRAPSRYRDDFEVREQLGRGGFGFVYKARNRLDGLLYAIKVIPIAGSDTSARTRKILREVMTLSRLHHENIVRYFQAWLEDAQPRAAGGQSGSDASSEAGSSEEASSDATSDDEDTASQGDSSDDARSASTRAERARAANAPTSLSDGDESGSGAESDSGSLAWHALGPRLGAPDGVDWRGSAAHGTADAPAQRRADRRRAAALPKRRRALYIQMEFCHQTLADRISTAAGALEEDEAWRLFRQVLVGVNYCHAKGIAHRDLKPTNIFIDAAGNIKLGDFGLATKLANPQHATLPPTAQASQGSAALLPTLPRSSTDRASVNYGCGHGGGGGGSLDGDGTQTSIVGTALYLDPHSHGLANGGAEAEGGAASAGLGAGGGGARVALKAVDMYALGIALYELNAHFGTAMERHVTLMTLRQTGEVPAGFAQMRPRQAALVRQLIQINPRLRPSAAAVLASELLPPVQEDERTREAVRLLLSSPHSPFFAQLLDGLFHPQRNHWPLDVASGWLAPGGGGELTGGQAGARGAAAELAGAAGARGGLAASAGTGRSRHGGGFGAGGGGAAGSLSGAGTVVRESQSVHRLVSQLERVFELHGGLYHEPPLLVPRPEADSDAADGGASAEPTLSLGHSGDGSEERAGGGAPGGALDGIGEAAVLMEPGGALLQLLVDSRHDLPRLLADWPDGVALRRYSVTRTHRRRRRTAAPTAAHRGIGHGPAAALGILPEHSLLADFDIISALPPPPDGASFAAATAEAIRVAWACVNAALPGADAQTAAAASAASASAEHFVILLNHGALRDAALDACGVPADEARRAAISRALLGTSHAGAAGAGVSSAELLRVAAGDQAVADALERFAAPPWPASRLEDLWLWALAGAASGGRRVPAAAHSARDELGAVLRCLELMGIPTHSCVRIAPLLPCGARASYAAGELRFDVRLRGSSRSLARGGRVDRALLRGRMAVGVSVAVRPLLAALGRVPARGGGGAGLQTGPGASGLPSAQCDVLVCSVGANLLDERVRITAELWAAGVRARCLYQPEVSYEEQLAWAQAHRVYTLVIVKDAARATGLVRVRHLAPKSELECDRADLARYFQAHAHPAAPFERRAEAPHAAALASGSAAMGGFAAAAAASAAAAAAAVSGSGSAASTAGAGGGGAVVQHGKEAAAAAAASAVAAAVVGNECGGGAGGGGVPISQAGLTKGQRAKLRRAQRGGH